MNASGKESSGANNNGACGKNNHGDERYNANGKENCGKSAQGSGNCGFRGKENYGGKSKKLRGNRSAMRYDSGIWNANANSNYAVKNGKN